MRNLTVYLLVCCGIALLLSVVTPAMAQDSTSVESTSQNTRPAESERLNRVAEALRSKVAQRSDLRSLLSAGGEDVEQVQAQLDELEVDIQALRDTFNALTIGNIDNSLFNDEEERPFDWQVEMMQLLEPLLESLQALTERPRRLSELRETIDLNQRRLKAITEVQARLQTLKLDEYATDAQQLITQSAESWGRQETSVQQRLEAAQSQLDRLEKSDSATQFSLLRSIRNFMLGRGLTLLLAVVAAMLAWISMRFLWWIFSTYLTNKEQRRHSQWYRLLSYSFYLVNILVCVIVVLAVLYAREDLLLMALSLVLLTLAVLGIRQYIPKYTRETKLLLNVGPVREGERVMYNSLPWQVNSINLHTVLWNPLLDGVVRLPLEAIDSLASRPVKDDLWFPSSKGDFVLLPSGTFGEVLAQTPELVQLKVLGGMIQTICTADYYAMNVTNLTSGGQYGVAVTFGFDYNLQKISLDKIPETLHAAVMATFVDQDLSDYIDSVLVDLKSASASSIDYLIFVVVKSEKASSYFKIQRLVQQSCVQVANDHDWNIPFPQIMVHQTTA